MVRYKIHYKRPTPVQDALRVVLVPVIAALLAIGGCVASRLEAKESTWSSPRTAPTEAPVMPRPAARAEIQVTSSTPSSSASPSGVPTTSPAAAARPSESRSSFPEVSSPSPRRAQSTGASSTASPSSQSSDLQEQQNFSARTELVPESIQSGELTPCQRSAAACFAAGGLDTLTDNLDGLAVNHDTGRFCFSFQEGCERR